MEEKKLQTPMSETEFKEKVKEIVKSNREKIEDDFSKGILHLRDYSGVKKFKSLRRAIRRGHVSIFGEVYPHRPFKNISSKKGNVTYNKKRIYEQLTHRNSKIA